MTHMPVSALQPGDQQLLGPCPCFISTPHTLSRQNCTPWAARCCTLAVNGDLQQQQGQAGWRKQLHSPVFLTSITWRSAGLDRHSNPYQQQQHRLLAKQDSGPTYFYECYYHCFEVDISVVMQLPARPPEVGPDRVVGHRL